MRDLRPDELNHISGAGGKQNTNNKRTTNKRTTNKRNTNRRNTNRRTA